MVIPVKIASGKLKVFTGITSNIANTFFPWTDTINIINTNYLKKAILPIPPEINY